MTSPSPETLEREERKLFVTDAELIRCLGVPEKIARDAIRALDRNRASGFARSKSFGATDVTGPRSCSG
jgi:hypothetical protein